MAEETDGLEEAIEGQIRVVLTAAIQSAERVAQAREQALERARRTNERELAEVQSRFDAERRTARAELANVYRPEWWDGATPQRLGDTYALATAWAGEDAEAQRAKDAMRAELRSRYGVDPAELPRDAAALRGAVESAERDRVATDAEWRRVREESAEALLLTQNADAAERAAEQARAAAEFEPDPSDQVDAEHEAKRLEDRAVHLRDGAAERYDSAERREATARELEAAGLDREAVATRMRADVSQAEPATQATRSTPGRASKPRRGRGFGSSRQNAGLTR